jgi:hypothetical protein
LWVRRVDVVELTEFCEPYSVSPVELLKAAGLA